MKKVALTLASVIAVAAFAPEASALPVFARQTGMACSACHYQHFPLLNAFGRSFKAGAYTMVGAQGMVEGEHLSIPDRLNMAVFTTAYYQNQDGGDATSTTAGNAATGSGQQQSRYGLPSSGGELSIFYGGKVSEFAGFLSELGLKGTGTNAGTSTAKLVMLWPVGDMRVGLSAYSGGAGAAYSFEYLNTGAVQNHKMMDNTGPSNQHVGTAYASQYMGTATSASGVHLVANSSMGFVNVGKYAAGGAGTTTAGTASADVVLNYGRVAGTFDLAGWDTAVGVQHFDGTAFPTTTTPVDYNANIIDAQAQGELAGMETGFYVSYGNAPSSNNGNMLAGTGSSFATAMSTSGAKIKNTALTTLNLATSIEIIPHTATVQLAYRKASYTPDAAVQIVQATGTYAGSGAGKSLDDNAIMIGATYELAMNMGLSLNYTTQSGSAWDAVDANAKAAGTSGAVGKSAWTLLLATAF